MPHPSNRPRRLRSNAFLRDMVREYQVSLDDLIAPLFVKEGKSIKEPIHFYARYFSLLFGFTFRRG